MNRLSPILLSAALAFSALLAVAFCPQPLAAAAHPNAHPVVKHPQAVHPKAVHPKPAHPAPKAKHSRIKPVSQPLPHPGKHVHGAAIAADAHSIPAVVRTRRGAQAASRRHSHVRDATPRSLTRVRFAFPAPLFGSHDSLVHQNEMAEADGLERILDDEDLNDRIAQGSLVPVPVSNTLHINPDLPENRRYCRPWTAKFLSDLSQAHSGTFRGSALDVTSAVRTVEFQRRLRFTNGNAAAAEGDIASPHLTGGTIDIAKQGMSSREIGWIRSWLIPLEQQGKIDVEEEFRQRCFHISVYKNYLSQYAKPDARPQSPMASGSMLAARAR